MNSRRLLAASLSLAFLWTAPRVFADTNTPVLAPVSTNPAATSLLGTNIAAAAKPAGSNVVYVIPVREDIDKSLVYIVRRGVKEAIANGAHAIILDMDTNGGRGDSMEDIMELVGEFDGPTYTFINKKAYSAGAFISAATKHIYMSPGSVIGAAAPMLVGAGGEVEKTPDTVERKFVSAYAAKIRAAAQKNGHNAEVFEAMVNKVKGLKIGDQVIIKEGEILTLTNVEAEKEYGTPPKKLLSEGTVADINELVQKVGLTNVELHDVKPTGAEQVASWITAIAPLLLLLGMLGIYIEVKLQTFGLIGVLAILCFVVYFFGHYIAGLSGLEFLALFALGVILILIEVFAFPGTMLFGALGALFIIVSVLMAMVDRFPNGPVLPTLPQLEMPLMKFSIAIAGTLVGAIVLGKYLPRTALFNALVLHTASGGEITAPMADTKAESLVGATGTSTTPLRPAGKAMIGDRLMDVVTEGDHIPPNAPVKVVAVEGNRVVVTKA